MTTAAGAHVVPHQPTHLPELAAADRGVASSLEAVLSHNTRRSYDTQWRIFDGWCAEMGLRSLPAEPLTVARYLAARAGSGASIATLRLATSAIAKAHEWAKLDSPCRDPGVRASLKGWGRRLAKPQRQSGALTADVLAVIRLTAVQPRRRGRGMETPAQARERGKFDVALVAALSDAGLRRSEASSLTWGNIQRWEDGSGRITVVRSKTDAEAVGAVVAITPAAMGALDAIRPMGVASSVRVFGLSESQIARRVKAIARAAGLADWEFFSGHSGRVGMARRMAQNGAPTHEIERQGRWKQGGGMVGRVGAAVSVAIISHIAFAKLAHHCYNFVDNTGNTVYGCCIHLAQRAGTQRERDDMTTTTEVGAYLSHLREKAGFKQNELAKKITWSPAVLSRVESGERALSPEERDSILEAIGTEEALGFKETVARHWLHLPRPPFGHPDELILWEAEQAIHDVKKLLDSPDIKNVVAKRLEESLLQINNTATPVSKTEHNIVFVGKIGVGKTTALCRMAGLEVLKGDRPEPVLEVGAGGTTVCEVRLQQGNGYGLHVEPMDADDFHREVLEFAHFLTRPFEEASPEQSEGDQDAHGTSKEIERVIRNMSGLAVIRRRLPEGKRERIDRAAKLAEEYNDPSTLAGEILALIRPQQRTKHQIWYPEFSGQEPLVWLKETFEQLNNGRHPEFSLPKRIDIVVPQTILGEGPLSVCLVDTKGIDTTAERADLEAYLNEPGTLMILCSSFNDTPSTEIQELLSRAKDARLSGLGIKAAVLSLPRSDEAMAVKDNQGMSAESVAEGYELKGEQAELRLKSQNLPYAAIEFFNAREDEPQDLTDFLLQRVEVIRQEQGLRLKEAISGAIELVENVDEAYAQESYQRVARRIRLWLKDNRDIDWLPGRLEDSLAAAIIRAHPASVNASVRREGNWHNPDYLHQLSHGARVIVARSVVPKQDDFESIARDIFRDEELAPAFGLVRQASSILEDGINSLLARSESLGERIYIQDLKPDAQLWGQCRSQWGLGYVGGLTYRERVCQYNRAWFSSNDAHRDFQAAVQQLAEREWRHISERLAAILDPEAVAA